MFKTRLEEQNKDVESVSREHYTRSGMKMLHSTINKSALTDHTIIETHIIDWSKSGRKGVTQEKTRERGDRHTEDRRSDSIR